MKQPKIACVVEWLVTYAGSEKVLEQIIKTFPIERVFAVVDFLENRSFLANTPVETTFIQKLPFARKKYRQWLPLMPLAIEQCDVSPYDIVLSSSHAVSKGVLTGPDQLHISYVHSPIRYAWDMQHEYLRESGLDRGLKGWIAKILLHRIRNWDYRTANGVDHFVANSEFIARRIKKIYGRDADVIYPPVDIDSFPAVEAKGDFYLTASRMVPYKKIELIVEAFAAMPNRKLVVIGDGPDFDKIKAKATPNIQLLGYQPHAKLREAMQNARAFVFGALEDFGIAPVEAQACGTPVIAYGRGGALETVVGLDQPSPTGVFFYEQTIEALKAAVEEFELNEHRIDWRACRANAEKFSNERFRQEFQAYVEAKWAAFQEARLPRRQTSAISA